MGKTKKTKKPKQETYPLPRKQPKYQNPPVFRGGIMAWRFNAVDRGGEFAWSQDKISSKIFKILECLASIETMHENDLEKRGCHFISLESLSDVARNRLQEICLDDIEQLYSIRVTGRERIFCVHRNTYMRVLWYDPDHRVCPSNKKNT